jgi:Tol biopolymer transport system component
MLARIGPSVSQVYVQDPLGSLERAVSAPGRTANGMAVSEDGATIAISYAGSPSQLFVGPTDGGPAQLVRSSTGSIRVFAISPDQGSVAFTETFPYNDGAMVMPLDCGAAVQATPRTTDFVAGLGTFSPDSRYFAWGGYSVGWADMYVTDTLTGTMSPITVPSPPTTSIMRFAWTSAANYLFVAFTLTPPAAALHLCTAPDSCAPVPGYDGTRTLNVSRDRTFAVLGVDAADGGTGTLDFLRVPLDGSAVTPMATDFQFSTGPGGSIVLSPDGQRFVVCQAGGIYVMPTAAFSQVTPFFTLPSGVGAEAAVFGLDSTQLVFRSNLEGFGSPNPDGWGLQRIDLTTPGQPPVLQLRVDGGSVWDFAWTP